MVIEDIPLGTDQQIVATIRKRADIDKRVDPDELIFTVKKPGNVVVVYKKSLGDLEQIEPGMWSLIITPDVKGWWKVTIAASTGYLGIEVVQFKVFEP